MSTKIREEIRCRSDHGLYHDLYDSIGLGSKFRPFDGQLCAAL